MHNPSRFCTRCHRELTDAASMEFGIGPDCRGLDNALLAKLYPSDIEKARSLFNEVDLTLVAPATLETVNVVCGDLYADSAPKRDDWRENVKRIEWALSFPANNYLRPQLTSVVAALGYVGLAALWNGDAKTGKCHVTFEDWGRIYVVAPRSKAGNATFRLILGRKWHGAGTLTKYPKGAWSFPAKEHQTVFQAVSKHFPINEGLAQAIADAKRYTAKTSVDTETVKAPPTAPVVTASVTAASSPVVIVQAAPAAPAPKPAAKCTLVKVGVLLKVTTPYNINYVNDLKKQIKWTDRKFNFTEKCWELTLPCEAKAKELVQKHFGEAPVVLEAP